MQTQYRTRETMRKHPYPHQPTPEQLAIREGDAVQCRRDDGTVTSHVATSDPWLMGGHTWVIKMSGISGGFALDRVRKVAVES